ncbi:phage portal protein [Pseudactinotalea sp. Z1732]|uniref:phage portal protein n=1 Tax=Micrococcales TaxID=85006 RepID=UPI003C7C7558
MLTPSEIQIVEQLKAELDARYWEDERHYRYYRLRQTLEHLGMAIPPNMRRFTVFANWPRVVVRTIAGRQKVRALILPGEEQADPRLRAIWDASNLTAHTKMFRRDALISGRAYMSVGANEHNPELPLVRVESPREMEALVDTRTETMTAAARFFGKDAFGMGPTNVTLYLPEETIWIEKDESGKWREQDRDSHGLGSVPVVMHLNERLSGAGFEGESELTDVIDLTDAVARSLTNLQFAQEGHGVPGKWATGVQSGDFVDENGKPISMFEAYYDVINMLTDKDAKWGQFRAADLKNFETALNIYGGQAALSYGFPARYFGINTTNPPAEGTVRADEIELINGVEDKNEAEGMVLGWIGALALRFATGEWVEGNRVRVDYFDPGTPTIAQRVDALAKLRATRDISREGMWDEMGWTEPRKAKERQYLAEEIAQESAVDLSFLNRGEDTGAVSALDPDEVKKRADAMAALYRAGVEPEDAAQQAGLAGIRFRPGVQPITIRRDSE